MADDLQLKVTLTGDGKRLSGTLENARGEVRQFGDMSDRQGRRASAAMDRTGQSVETVSRDLRDTQGEVRQFGDISDRQGRRASAAMERTGRSVETVGGHLREMNSVGKTVRSTLLGAGTALVGMSAGTGVLLAMGRQASQTAAEIQRLSRIAGTSTREFQSLAYGAAQYGVEQDKLADIIRDTQDRIGDFLQTGAGEFVDFFEQIAPQANLSAEALARMSGPDALQAVYSALEDAGLSASEMTFYMEALASGATELIPLLRDSGAEVDRLGREADELNVVLSDLELQRLKDIRNEFHQLEQQLSTETARAVSQFDELIKSSLEGISWGINNVARGFNVFMDDFRENDAKRSIAGIDAELNTLFDTKQRLEERINLFGEDSAQARDAKTALEELKGEYDELIDRKIQIQQAGQPVTEPEIVKIARASTEFKTLNDWLFETAESTQQNADATSSAAESTDTFASDLESLREQLDPAYAASQRLAEATALLDQGLLSGAITLDEYLGLWDKAAERFISAGDGAKDAANTVDDESDAMATLWERRLERMDDAAVDMWRSFLDGSEGAFDSFKRLALDTLAEVIHQYTTKQITANLGANIGGGGSQGQMLGGQSGGMDVGALLKAGKWGYDQLFGASGYSGGWAESAIAGANSAGAMFGSSSGLSSTAINSANAVAGGAGGSGLGWTSYGSGGGYGTSLMNAGAGMAASYVGGEVGNWAGEAAFGKTANSNYGQTAGAAVGSIWGPIGTGVGAAIGSAVDVLFGSNEKTYDFDFKQGGQYGVFGDRESELGQFGVTSFSDYKKGEQQDQLNELMTSIEQFDNELSAAAVPQRVDAMRESIQGFTHDDPEDLFTDRLRAIIDGSGAVAEDAIENIADGEKLTQAILASLRVESIGRELGGQMTREMEQWIVGADNVTAAAVSMDQAAQAAALLVTAQERLGIQFDETANGAIHAASKLASAAGGVDELASLQQGYYQAVASQTEQAAHAYSNVYEALRDVTDQVPESVAGYRQLVRAQDLNTEAGRETYTQLLKLAPAFAQVAGGVKDVITSIYNDVLKRDPDEAGLNYYVDAIESGSMTVSDALNEIRSSSEAASVAANGAADSINDQAEASRLADQRDRMEVEILRLQGREEEALRRERELELESMNESLRPLKERMWALQDAAEAEEEAKQKAEERAKALRDAEKERASFATTIRSWIDQMESTDRGLASPGDQLAAASEAYREQLEAARSGDRDALGSITQYADRFIEAQEGWSGSGGETASVIDGIKSELAELPERLSAEEFLAQEFRSAITEDLPHEIERAIFDTRYRISSLIEFAADAEGLPADLRSILQTRAHELSATIDYLVGSNELDPDHRRLALEASNSYVTWLDLVVREDLTAGNRRLALGSTNDYQTWLDLAVRSDQLSPDNRQLALQSANDYAVYVSNVLEKDLAPGTRRLALQRGNDYAASVALVLSADISADNRRLALSAGNEYRAWLDLAVRSNISRDNRRLALNNGNTYQTWLDLAVREDLDAGDRRMALSSANRYAVHVQNILKSDLSADNRRLALRSGNDYSVAVNAALKGGVSSSVRELVFSAGNAYTTVVDGVMARGFNRNVRKLALESGNQFTTSMRAYLRDGELSRSERKLLNADAEDIVRQLRVSGGLDLSDDEWAVINAAEGTKRLEVLADVAFKPAEMKALGSIEVNTRKVREFFERAGSPSWGLRVSMANHQDVGAVRSFGYHTAKQFRSEFKGSGTGLPVTIANNHNQGGIRAIAGVWKNEWKNRGVQGFAHGGWTGPGGKYDEAGVVHANEFVVRSEIVRQPGVRDMLESLNRGGAPMPAPPTSMHSAPMPPSPLQQRGSRDDALLREANALHREMTQLLEELRRYAQSDQAQRGEGFRRVERATERGNKMLSRLAADKRLEEARA